MNYALFSQLLQRRGKVLLVILILAFIVLALVFLAGFTFSSVFYYANMSTWR